MKTTTKFLYVRRVPAVLPLACKLVLVSVLLSGCSHLNPFERAARAKADPDAVERLLPQLPAEVPEADQPEFIGSVAAGLHEADTLRYALLKSASEMSNERAAYDALLWTLGPYLLYRAVNGGPSSKEAVQRGGSVLAAGYGFLKARPKEYEQIFIQGADRMSCLLIDSTRYLYTREELELTEEEGDPSGLERNLQTAIINYAVRSSEISQAALYISPPQSTAKCAMGGSGECRQREAQLRPAAPDRSSQAKSILDLSDERIRLAQRDLDGLKHLNSELRSEARNRLGIRSKRLMESVRAELLGKRPDIASVSDILPIIQQSMDKMVTAAKAQSSGSRQKAALPDGRLIRIPPGVSKERRDNFLKADQELQEQLARTRIILALRDQKNARTDATLREEGCPATPAGGTAPSSTSGSGANTAAAEPSSVQTSLQAAP